MNSCIHRPAFLHWLFPRRSGQQQPFICKHCGKPIRASRPHHHALLLIPIVLLLLLWFSRIFTGFPSLPSILAICLLDRFLSWRMTFFCPMDTAAAAHAHPEEE